MLIKLVLLLIILIVGYRILKPVIKDTPPAVKKISIILLIAGMVLLEVILRMRGGAPYYRELDPMQSALGKIMPPDELVDEQAMICDSFGVNKLNTRKKEWTLVNKDGFRSYYEFNQGVIDSLRSNGRKTVLMIGDSYTYGLSADSGYSFSNAIENTGEFAVLNAGIPGTDMPQYQGVVQEYITSGKIKPDQIAIFVTDNDLHHNIERRLTPGKPILYNTNAGGVFGYHQEYDTTYPSAKIAYENILDKHTIIGITGNNAFTRIAGKSVLLTRIIAQFASNERPAIEEKPTFDLIVADIKNDCAKVGIPVTFFLLPSKKNISSGEYPPVKGVASLDLSKFTMKDYNINMDDHPINEGHRKIAEQVLPYLRKM